MMLLSEWMALHGDAMELPCGGNRKCLKCRVRVSGAVALPDAAERALLTDEELADGIRYACMARVSGSGDGIRIERVGASGGESIVTAGALPAFLRRPWAEGLGLAVDIGTTTVAAYLYRLCDGAQLAEGAEKNPQGVYGADVTSRIDRALGKDGAGLMAAIHGCIWRLSDALCKKARVSPDAIRAAVLTGNTAMLYFLTGQNPVSISAAPFAADCLFGLYAPPETVGLGRGVKAYLPSCLGAYTGADLACAMLAAGFDKPRDSARLLVDIGTNGEMALSVGDALLCCSTAAGPALEGAGISCGMTARTGAIHRVWVQDGEMCWETLGDAEPQGLCGSGLVDAVAAMLEMGALDESGRLSSGESFALPGTAITLTQGDIRAMQLAKGAICAGMRTLLQTAGLAPEDVQEVLIAGGFGIRINPESAERIGLLPEGYAKKVRPLGNAAGMGAAMCLQSTECMETLEGFQKKARVVELASNPVFADAFVECMMFA